MSTDPRVAITAANTALGIEFGSTRIKAVLIGPDHQVLATGGHGWENHLEGGLWSYRLDEVVAGLDASDEQKAAVSAVILPKMLVGGFTTVTIASVVFAGIISPFIFS